MDFSQTLEAARTGAAWCRRHDLGFISIRGKDRISFLHGLLSADIKKLELGRGTPACLLTAKGAIVAPMGVHHLPDEHLLVGPAEAMLPAAAMLTKMAPLSDCTVEVHDFAAWLVTGAKKAAVLESLAGRPCDPGPGGAQAFLTSAGSVGVLSDFHSGTDGVLFVVPDAAADRFAGVLAGGVSDAGAVELPEAALETLRVEAGMPAWGREMDGDSFPQEVRLEAWVSHDKGCYLGQETMARLRDRGHVNKVLAALRLDAPVAVGDAVEGAGGEKLGKVTSLAPSSKAGAPLALAVLKREAGSPGVPMFIWDGAKKVGASYQELPL
ncbi:MAG: aminomethyltransferase [Elusimicrobia bacterium]|nr:MAG: aminomethyltransferase [Elusimicrobiota bacterium]